MKKLSIILFLFSAVFVSCEPEYPTYDNVGGQAFLKFETSTVDLPIPRTGTETISIPISVSTISNTDRTVTVSLVPEETTLDAANFSFTREVVIPANSYTGMLEVTGNNANLVIGEVETITFKIEGLSAGDFNASDATVTVRGFLSCAFDPMEFVGTYSANDGAYEVEISYDEGTGLFLLENLYDGEGETYAEFSYENSIAFVDFKQNLDTNYGVLYVHSTLGNVYAVNPSVRTGNPSSNVSTFRTCDNFLDLTFFRRIQDGRYFAGPQRVTLTKKE